MATAAPDSDAAGCPRRPRWAWLPPWTRRQGFCGLRTAHRPDKPPSSQRSPPCRLLRHRPPPSSPRAASGDRRDVEQAQAASRQPRARSIAPASPSRRRTLRRGIRGLRDRPDRPRDPQRGPQYPPAPPATAAPTAGIDRRTWRQRPGRAGPLGGSAANDLAGLRRPEIPGGFHEVGQRRLAWADRPGKSHRRPRPGDGPQSKKRAIFTTAQESWRRVRRDGRRTTMNPTDPAAALPAHWHDLAPVGPPRSGTVTSAACPGRWSPKGSDEPAAGAPGRRTDRCRVRRRARCPP